MSVPDATMPFARARARMHYGTAHCALRTVHHGGGGGGTQCPICTKQTTAASLIEGGLRRGGRTKVRGRFDKHTLDDEQIPSCRCSKLEEAPCTIPCQPLLKQ